MPKSEIITCPNDDCSNFEEELSWNWSYCPECGVKLIVSSPEEDNND